MSKNKVPNDVVIYISMTSQLGNYINVANVINDVVIYIGCRNFVRVTLIIIKIIKCICRDVFVLLVGAFKIAPLLTKAHAQHMTLARVKREGEEEDLSATSGRGGSK